jgi:hypothetical protein
MEAAATAGEAEVVQEDGMGASPSRPGGGAPPLLRTGSWDPNAKPRGRVEIRASARVASSRLDTPVYMWARQAQPAHGGRWRPRRLGPSLFDPLLRI